MGIGAQTSRKDGGAIWARGNLRDGPCIADWRWISIASSIRRFYLKRMTSDCHVAVVCGTCTRTEGAAIQTANKRAVGFRRGETETCAGAASR